MTRVMLHPYTETLAVAVYRDCDDNTDDVVDVPEPLLAAFERAQCAAYDAGETLVAVARGGQAAQVRAVPAKPDVPSVVFGDPMVCWNPVRHQPHSFLYEVGPSRGMVSCDGRGELAGHMLGVEHATAPARCARIADLIQPCPPPDADQGYSDCAHGPWPCALTEAAWLARGTTVEEEVGRVAQQWRSRMRDDQGAP